MHTEMIIIRMDNTGMHTETIRMDNTGMHTEMIVIRMDDENRD